MSSTSQKEKETEPEFQSRKRRDLRWVNTFYILDLHHPVLPLTKLNSLLNNKLYFSITKRSDNERAPPLISKIDDFTNQKEYRNRSYIQLYL